MALHFFQCMFLLKTFCLTNRNKQYLNTNGQLKENQMVLIKYKAILINRATEDAMKTV